MKSDSYVKRQLRVLRRECIDNQSDPALSRIAYAMEIAIRWAREDVVAWPTPANEARALAKLLREELWPHDFADDGHGDCGRCGEGIEAHL